MDTECDLSDAQYYIENGLKIGFTRACAPSWERNDCAVVSLAITTDIPYKLAHEILKSWGRKNRSYTPNWKQFVRQGPFKWKSCPIAPITIKNFAKKHPEGSYIVFFRPRSYNCHAASVVDGTFYNCNVDSSKCRVKLAWRFDGLKKDFIKKHKI